ncbi:MAG: hypothetical protein PWQ29_803 [Verrucomicrobiota bacterium]|jgi:hypothetical protein|nr:hypothetical protein [Verrucomicrobiota bacterium]MDK2963409.1 hypothetical protein [Verrucomicrobiota bacterium]
MLKDEKDETNELISIFITRVNTAKENMNSTS